MAKILSELIPPKEPNIKKNIYKKRAALDSESGIYGHLLWKICLLTSSVSGGVPNRLLSTQLLQ